MCFFFFFQAEDGIRDLTVTGVQTCALPILMSISTMATSAVDSSSAIASLPVVALKTFMPRRSSTLLSAKMLRRSEEHTSELQSQSNLVCRLLLEKKKKTYKQVTCSKLHNPC